MVTEERFGSLERTVRGDNGNSVGLVGEVRSLKQFRAEVDRPDLDRHEDILCNPEKGLVYQVAAFKTFKDDATEFMKEARGLPQKLMLAVIGSLISGIILNIIVEYVIQRGITP